MKSFGQKLQQWYQSPLGKSLLATETRALNQILPTFFGYYLLQLGGPMTKDFLASSPINTKILAAPEMSSGVLNYVQCDYQRLPFLTESIDLIIAHHLLEFINNPQKILHEAYTTLIAGGHLIIFGFNPQSLWGLFNSLHKNRQNPPWSNHWISPGKMQTLLRQTGFQVGDYKTFYFEAPFHDPRKIQKFLFMESVGQILWPYCGASYLIVAQKTGVRHIHTIEKITTPVVNQEVVIKHSSRVI